VLAGGDQYCHARSVFALPAPMTSTRSTDDVALRPPQPSDFPALLRWRSDREHQRLLMWRAGAESLEDVAAWVERRTSDPDGRFDAVVRGDVPIGFVQLTRIDRIDGHAHLGMLIDPLERGRGAAARALALMEQEARAMGLRKILLEVLPDNERAMRFWIAAGYGVVGTHVRHHRHEASYFDISLLEKFIIPTTH
jgi:RimJ/RimL family protein N-acetyltransferase